MTWPLYFPATLALPDELAVPVEWRPMVRHDQRERHPSRTGRPRSYGVAIDVWRDEQHLWRSYGAETGSTCDSWADENLGAEAPRNHDGGRWGVPGVADVADWPIPTPDSLLPVWGLHGVADLIYTLTMLALRSGRPHFVEPARLSKPPSEASIRQRLSHADRGDAVVAFEEEGVSVRAMIAPMDSADFVAAASGVPLRRWRATISRRATRHGVVDTSNGAITAGLTACIDVPVDAPVHIIARRAKRALGVAGWQAARVRGATEWHLARTPYLMRIESVDDSVKQHVDSMFEENGA